MNKEDIFILILALLLLAAMIYTFLFGGQSSKHGVSLLPRTEPAAITCLDGILSCSMSRQDAA